MAVGASEWNRSDRGQLELLTAKARSDSCPFLLQTYRASFDKLRMRGILGGTKKRPHPELVEGRRSLIPFPCKRRRWQFALAALALGVGLFSWGYWSAELIAPAATPLLLDRHGEFLAQVAAPDGGGYGYWPVGQLPPRVVAATLSLEDRRFWSHPGVDPIAIVRALWQNLASGERVSGASTLAMQVARLQDPGPRTYYRKASEAAAALFMTLRYGREAILAQYLRLVPYGNDVHGIAYAARLYFDKPVADLSWAEIAFLAAIPQAPSRMNPLSPTQRDFAIARGHRILAALRSDRVLSPAEFALAEAQLDDLPRVERAVRPDNALHAILNLRDALAGDDLWRRRRDDFRV